ncbi:MAG: membrane protein insertase YidC, partial [Actinomycetia bacterium]|nr:membrane protein insertase YidC [Actinomycetes bacterium]
TVDENRSLGNYVFSAEDVGNFLDANFFGAPLGAFMTQQNGLEAFTQYGAFSRPALIAVTVPVMIAAGIATYFNSRASVARQSPEAAANPQTAIMNKLALYVFPLGVVAGGPFLPLAIILYWFSNNIWTFGQQHYVFGKIEQEEEQAKQEALERRAANAPAPGAKPKKKRANVNRDAESGEATPESGSEQDGARHTEPKGGASSGAGKSAAAQRSAKPKARNAAANRTPRPGARPKKRKR